jgi:hypothetical protein
MRTMITSGQASDLETKVRLKDAKLIEGPGATNLHRGRSYQEFMSKILRYSTGWLDLQWASHMSFGLPCPGNTQWHDGTVPTHLSFVGESGGCIYNVTSILGNATWYSELTVVRPASQRTGRQVFQFSFKLGFPIRAVAVDSTSLEVVLLERFFYSFFV